MDVSESGTDGCVELCVDIRVCLQARRGSVSVDRVEQVHHRVQAAKANSIRDLFDAHPRSNRPHWIRFEELVCLVLFGFAIHDASKTCLEIPAGDTLQILKRQFFKSLGVLIG